MQKEYFELERDINRLQREYRELSNIERDIWREFEIIKMLSGSSGKIEIEKVENLLCKIGNKIGDLEEGLSKKMETLREEQKEERKN